MYSEVKKLALKPKWFRYTLKVPDHNINSVSNVTNLSQNVTEFIRNIRK